MAQQRLRLAVVLVGRQVEPASRLPAVLVDAPRRDHEAIDFDRPILDRLEMVQAAHQRALSGPRWADDGDRGAVLDIEVDPPEHVELAEPFPDAGRSHQRFFRPAGLHHSVPCCWWK